MRWGAILRLLGLLVILNTVSFLPSLGVSLLYDDGEAVHFLDATIISLAAGVAIWLPLRTDRRELKMRDGFMLVVLIWAVLGVVGGIPFLLGLHLDFTDSVFEAVSGFTTAGATVISGLDRLPPSILYHRQQIQWFGGMGVVVLAVAVLPVLGVGGMQLYRAEASGITKEEKLTPRIAHTARALWTIYLGLTLSCALAYWLAGMSGFDAIAHAFSTVATGGFSTHDASIGYFDNVAIEIVCTIFMLLGGVNFAMHFLVWRRRSLRPYLDDPETRAYGVLVLGFVVLVVLGLVVAGAASPLPALRMAVFQVASVITSTGFSTADYSVWPQHLPLLMAILAYIGGCAGSTAGGLKVVRVLLLAKIGVRQFVTISHSRAITLVKLGQRRVPEEILYSVWAYYSLYILTALVLTVAMMAAGLDLTSAFGAVTASINLLGPGLGKVASSFAGTNDLVKWLAVFAMLVGRLEVFTLLILFSPAFWRH